MTPIGNLSLDISLTPYSTFRLGLDFGAYWERGWGTWTWTKLDLGQAALDTKKALGQYPRQAALFS